VSANEVQVQYDMLEKMIQRFHTMREDHETMYARLRDSLGALEQGGMVGKAGDKFFAEMSQEALPSLQRLQSAFTTIAQALADVMRVIRDAEQQASNLFKGDSGTEASPRFQSIANGSDFGVYSDQYDTITDALRQKGGLAGQVQFFDAASDVTDWNNLGLIEVSKYSPSWMPITGGMSFQGAEYMKGISNHLYETVNRPHAERLLNATGDSLPSPSGDPNETFKTALAHDLRMVEVEQGEVDVMLKKGIASGQLSATDVEHLKFGASHDWADAVITDNANFTNLEYRKAMGKAIIFEKHGLSQEQYIEYMKTQRS
jgi:WXG100 family type VII secretion target